VPAKHAVGRAVDKGEPLSFLFYMSRRKGKKGKGEKKKGEKGKREIGLGNRRLTSVIFIIFSPLAKEKKREKGGGEKEGRKITVRRSDCERFQAL